MEEQHAADDQSHYEISLTAGQAFIAFVLLLLSLAASFAFGLMLGKGQADERLVVRKESPVVTEASMTPKKPAGEIVELGVDASDFDENAVPAPAAPAATESATAVVEEHGSIAAPAADAPATETVEPPAQKPAAEAAPAAAQPESKPAAAPAHVPVKPAGGAVYFAQLLSTGDQKTAEGLAVKLINRGFDSAYVERGATDKGPVYRVRVRFGSESEARNAEPKLREFSKDVWITAR